LDACADQDGGVFFLYKVKRTEETGSMGQLNGSKSKEHKQARHDPGNTKHMGLQLALEAAGTIRPVKKPAGTHPYHPYSPLKRVGSLSIRNAAGCPTREFVCEFS